MGAGVCGSGSGDGAGSCLATGAGCGEITGVGSMTAGVGVGVAGITGAGMAGSGADTRGGGVMGTGATGTATGVGVGRGEDGLGTTGDVGTLGAPGAMLPGTPATFTPSALRIVSPAAGPRGTTGFVPATT
jgi:hypothetical protein